MEHKKQTSLTLLKAFTCAIITVGVMAVAHAQDTKVDPSGTWTWANRGRNGNPGTTNTLVLKYSNNSLTGTLKAPKRGGGTTDTEISDGKLTGAQISFNISRESNGNTMTFGLLDFLLDHGDFLFESDAHGIVLGMSLEIFQLALQLQNGLLKIKLMFHEWLV